MTNTRSPSMGAAKCPGRKPAPQLTNHPAAAHGGPRGCARHARRRPLHHLARFQCDFASALLLLRESHCSAGIRLGNGVIQNKDTIVATKAGVLNVTKKKNGTKLPSDACAAHHLKSPTSGWKTRRNACVLRRIRALTHHLHPSIFLNKKTSLSASSLSGWARATKSISAPRTPLP